MRYVNKLYSNLIKWRFASFGKGSNICFPLKVNHPESVTIGDNVVLRENAWLNCTEKNGHETKLKIGNDCYIGRFVQINAYESVVLEDKVFIDDRAYIADVDHEYSDNDIPIMYQGTTEPNPVTLKKGCRIGTGAAILPGVTIGVHSVVTANAVVTRDVPDSSVATGVPARTYSKTNIVKFPPNK